MQNNINGHDEEIKELGMALKRNKDIRMHKRYLIVLLCSIFKALQIKR